MKAGTGSPSWRQLGMLTALVLAAHALLLHASPGRLGLKSDSGDRDSKAFTTRSIEQKPAPAAAVAAAVPAPKAAPKPVPAKVQAEPSPIVAQAPHALATPPLLEPLPDTAQSTPAVTSTIAATPPAAVAATVPASGAATSQAASPGGPKTTLVTAIALPESVVLKYVMTGTSRGLNYHADAELGWKNTGSQYDAYMSVSAMFIGARTMTSVGSVTSVGLAPTRFADKFRSEQAAHFEPDKGKITFSANTPQAPWIEGSQDRVSVFMQLAGMLAAKPADFPVGSEISLYTVGPRDADTWTFVVESEEKLQLPRGETATLKLTRKPRGERDQKVEIWYAPSLGYLPVRNRITQENGDFIDQQLSKLVRP